MIKHKSNNTDTEVASDEKALGEYITIMQSTSEIECLKRFTKKKLDNDIATYKQKIQHSANLEDSIADRLTLATLYNDTERYLDSLKTIQTILLLPNIVNNLTTYTSDSIRIIINDIAVYDGYDDLYYQAFINVIKTIVTTIEDLHNDRLDTIKYDMQYKLACVLGNCGIFKAQQLGNNNKYIDASQILADSFANFFELRDYVNASKISDEIYDILSYTGKSHSASIMLKINNAQIHSNEATHNSLACLTTQTTEESETEPEIRLVCDLHNTTLNDLLMS